MKFNVTVNDIKSNIKLLIFVVLITWVLIDIGSLFAAIKYCILAICVLAALLLFVMSMQSVTQTKGNIELPSFLVEIANKKPHVKTRR